MSNSDSNETTTKAVLSLVFGILAVAGACPCVGGVLALVFGNGEKSGVGRVGWILGLVHLAMLAFALVVAGLAIAFAILVSAVN